MKKHLKIIVGFLALVLFTGCGKFQNIEVNGTKDMKFKGMKDGVIFLNITFDINNPNPKKLVVKKFEFKAWFKKREFGKLKSTQKLVIPANSRADYEVPVEITLKTAADALKLIGQNEKILSMLTVEGFIKGGRFPIIKKVKIPRQSFTEFLKLNKNRISVSNDTIPGETNDN